MSELQKHSLFYSKAILNELVKQAILIGTRQEGIEHKLKNSLNFSQNLFNEIINIEQQNVYHDNYINYQNMKMDFEPTIMETASRQNLFSKIKYRENKENTEIILKQKQVNKKVKTKDLSQLNRIGFSIINTKKQNSLNKQKQIKTNYTHQLTKRPKQQRFVKIQTDQLYENNEDELRIIQNQLRQNKTFTQSVQKRKTLIKTKKKVQNQEEFSFSQTVNPITYSLSQPKKIKKNKSNFVCIKVKAERSLKIYNFQKSDKVKMRDQQKKQFFQNYHQNYEGEQQKMAKQNGLKLKQQEQFIKKYNQSQTPNRSIKNESVKSFTCKKATQKFQRRSVSVSATLSTSKSLKKLSNTKRLSRADPKLKIQLPTIKKPENRLKLSNFHQNNVKNRQEKSSTCYIKLQNNVGYNFLLDKNPKTQQNVTPPQRTSKLRISIMNQPNKIKNTYFNKFFSNPADQQSVSQKSEILR